jgi:PAS domain S-box-containing protein
MLLGIMIAFGLAPYPFAHGERFHAPGSALLSIAAIAVFTLIVVGLVVLKSLEDRRYQGERDLLEAFLEHIPDNVFFKDRSSRFVLISHAMAKYFGMDSPAQALGKTDIDIFSSEHAKQAFEDEQEIIRTGQAKAGMEQKETWPDGHESWVLTTKIPLRDRRGRIIGTMGIAHNITDRKLAEARIQYMALHDALTGLPNSFRGASGPDNRAGRPQSEIRRRTHAGSGSFQERQRFSRSLRGRSPPGSGVKTPASLPARQRYRCASGWR